MVAGEKMLDQNWMGYVGEYFGRQSDEGIYQPLWMEFMPRKHGHDSSTNWI